MGGTVVIVDPSLAPFLTNTRADPTGTGLVTALEFARNGHRFVIISAYLPPYASENTPESTKLHSRIRRYLKSKGITGQSHRAFLQMIIDKWVSAYEAKEFVILLGGDLNGILENQRGRQTLLPWVSSLAMQIPFTRLLLPKFPDYYTWKSGDSRSRVDHVLNSRLPSSWQIAEIGVDEGNPFSDVSDHRLVYIGYTIHGFDRKVPKVARLRRPKRLDLDLKAKEKVQEYADGVSEWIRTHPFPEGDMSAVDAGKRISLIMMNSLIIMTGIVLKQART